jgi:hypothetical protein
MIDLLPLLLAAAAPQSDPCSARILDYAGWKESDAQEWNFQWPPDDGMPPVTIIGVEHGRNMPHDQFLEIAENIGMYGQTLAFFEGPDRGVGTSEYDTITRFGESGYVRFLAREVGLRTRSLEMSPPVQAKLLLAGFPADQVMLFFVLREAARLRDREGRSGAALDEAVTVLLQRMQPMAAGLGIESPLADLAALDAAAAHYWPGRDWRTLPSAWFSPLADDRVTGGRFLGAINRADSNNRNRHMFELIVAAVRDGERVFVAVGRNHVPMLAPALECALPALFPRQGQSG